MCRVAGWFRSTVLFLGLAAWGTAGCVAELPEDTQTGELSGMVGQMVMIGFRGDTVQALGPAARQIQKHNLGGVVLFDYDVPSRSPERNIRSREQLRELTAGLQRLSSGVPLLIAIDQEGGKVSRLKQEFGFPPTVSAQHLGEKNDPALTYRHARQTAGLLRELGINMNFAPVVDLNVNPQNPIIGGLERSFSGDPSLVAIHAAQVIRAHHDQGVLSVVKHFPGHGSSLTDSHEGFTDVTGTWSQEELIPYEMLLEQVEPDGVMTAHIYNRNLDPEHPATLSERVIRGTLRRNLGFDGVVVTDDLQMGAIRDEYGFKRTVQLAVESGADILLFANNSVYDPEIGAKAVRAILELVQEGAVSRERILQSYARIIGMKNRLQEGFDGLP